MRLVITHAFTLPRDPAAAWFLVEGWAAALGYRVVERRAGLCRIERGKSTKFHQAAPRDARTWGEIRLDGDRGVAALALSLENPGFEWFERIDGRAQSWEAYLRGELELLGREVDASAAMGLAALHETAQPEWSFDRVLARARELIAVVRHKLRSKPY
ncbi:MAG: hypothetical protein JWM77_106 [Rhodospirillales bacterium]|nr:hypothetical protein [Rhodospirillales bacterium]